MGVVRLPGEGDPVSVRRALHLSGVMLSHCPCGPCSSSRRRSDSGGGGQVGMASSWLTSRGLLPTLGSQFRAMSAPPGGFSAGLGRGWGSGTWEPSGRGHTVARGTVWDADLPLCWDQRGVVFSCPAPDRLLLEHEPVPRCSLFLARHVQLQT